MENRIALALRIMILYIVYLIEPGLTIVAAIFVLPWLTEKVDHVWVGILRTSLVKLNVPDILRLRLIIALMFWPTLFKSLCMPIIWTLLSSQNTGLESRVILGFLLYSLLVSAALVYNPKVTRLLPEIPSIDCSKEAGYRAYSLAHSLFLPLVSLWMWYETGEVLCAVAILMSAVFNAARSLGRIAFLQLPYFTAHSLLLMTILEPNPTEVVWILVLFSSTVLFSYRAIIRSMTQKIRQNQLLRFLRSDRSIDEFGTTRDRDFTGR